MDLKKTRRKTTFNQLNLALDLRNCVSVPNAFLLGGKISKTEPKTASQIQYMALNFTCRLDLWYLNNNKNNNNNKSEVNERGGV